MKKISTVDLVTGELKNYLDGVLSCFNFCDSNLGQYVTGKALELLKKLPESERACAIVSALGTVDYDCINGFPYPQDEDEFLLPPTELEIDITNIALETPEDFHIEKMGDCKLAYYALDYGAFIGLDLDKLEEYVTEYLEDQKN
jgi:hypothetical protein